MSPDYETSDTKPVKRGTIHGPWSAKRIPDGADFPDPYEVTGDVYERSQTADEWEILDP